MPHKRLQRAVIRQRTEIVVTDPGLMTPERVRAIRELTGKSPARFGEFLGVSASAVRNWEIDQHPIGTMSLVLALIEAYGIRHVSLPETLEYCAEKMPSCRIREVRAQEGFSQGDFARALSMNRDMLSRIENGERPPAVGALRLLVLVALHGIRRIVLPEQASPRQLSAGQVLGVQP